MNENDLCKLINNYIELKKSQKYVLYKSKNQISLHQDGLIIVDKTREDYLNAIVSHGENDFIFRIAKNYYDSRTLNIEFLNIGEDEKELIRKLKKHLYREELNYKRKYRWYQLIAPEKRGLYSYYNGTEPLNIYVAWEKLQDIVSLKGNGGMKRTS